MYKLTAYEWVRVITKSIDLKPILVRKMAPEIDPNRRGLWSIFWIDFWSDFGPVLEVLWDPCGAQFWDEKSLRKSTGQEGSKMIRRRAPEGTTTIDPPCRA